MSVAYDKRDPEAKEGMSSSQLWNSFKKELDLKIVESLGTHLDALNSNLQADQAA